MAMCSPQGPAEVDTRAVDEEAIRVLPKLASLNPLNQELLLALVEGDTDEELAEYFTSGDIQILRGRLGNLFFRQLGLDPSVPVPEVIEILKKAFEHLRVRVA